jgi:uncharacterized protein YbjT (DUF2867 family)
VKAKAEPYPTDSAIWATGLSVSRSRRAATVLVTGATGKAGRQMVRYLAAAGAAVRAGSRHPAAASPGVTPVVFDWYDKATWTSALGDADWLIVKGLEVDHYGYETVAALIASASAARGVLMLSNPRIERLPDDHPRRAFELTVLNSGRQPIILRANWFMQNFDEHDRAFAAALRTKGELHAPAGQGRVSFVDTRDIAAAAVAAMSRAGDEAQEYTLTGPEALTFGQVAEAIGRASGRDIRHVDATPAEHREHMRGPDRTAPYADHINGLFTHVRSGSAAPVSDDCRRLTGHQPRTFDAYLDEVWTPAAVSASAG